MADVTSKKHSQEELLADIAAGKIFCTYCAELATTITEDGCPICDIPGNHP